MSKNHLKGLPKNFGRLVNLKHLDLLSNDLEVLPFSFSELKSLQWLDLKNNPLNPQLKQVAGDCLDEAQCKKCAVNVVRYMKLQAAEEDRRVQEIQRVKREELLRLKIAEEEEQKRLREAKKEEKEKKKQELLKLKAEQQQKRKEEKEIDRMDSENDGTDEKMNDSGKNKRQKPFILRLLNFIFLSSFFIFLIFILFSIYCDKFTTYSFFDTKSKSQHVKYGIEIQKNLNQICHKYDFQFKYLVNHFRRQFNF